VEVIINVNNNNVVQLAEHLASTIAKNYNVYLAIKKILFRLRFSKGLSSEQEEKIRSLHNKFDRAQQEYFLWGTK